MQRVVLSTEHIAEHDRFSYWREEVLEGMFGVSGERAAREGGAFEGQAVGWVGESFLRFRHRSDSFPVFRRASDVARKSWDDRLWLYRELSEAGGTVGGREVTTRPGDLIIADPSVPFATEARRAYDVDVWLFPRGLIEAHLAPAMRPRSMLLSDGNGVNALVRAYLGAFSEQIDTLADADAGVVADNFCRLLALACGAAAGEQHEAIRAARFEQAKRYIELHLSEPALAPETVAAAMKISVRQLHLLFEPSGTSVARYLLRRRIEECRAALASPAASGRSVTDIALGWGFNSLPTFYRTFQRAFGTTPGELRPPARPKNQPKK